MGTFNFRDDVTLRRWVGDRLRAGQSTKSIAAEWTEANPDRSMTKNQVVGANHRWHLAEPQENPVGRLRWSEAEEQTLRDNQHMTCAQLVERMPDRSAKAVKDKRLAMNQKAEPAPARPPQPVFQETFVSAPKPVIAAPSPVAIVNAPPRTGLQCQWLNGSGSPDWDQCTANATHGRTESSWCDRHRARVFVGRGRDAEAA